MTSPTGEQHTIYFEGTDANATLMVASTRRTYQNFIGTLSAPNKAAALTIATQLDTMKGRPASSFTGSITKDELVERLFNRLVEQTGLLITTSPAVNAYPGSALDPQTRTNAQLWQDITPDPIPGQSESSTDISRRRLMARGVLLQRYSGGARNVAQKIMEFNLGRDIRAFDLQRNESENYPDAHVIDRHVLNGSGRIKNLTDLALRALLDRPSTGGQFVASAYLSLSAAGSTIRGAIAARMAGLGGWPQFRDHIAANSGSNVLPSSISGGPGNARVLRNPTGAVVTTAVLPAYLNGRSFEGIAIVGAVGTRPLFPGDGTGGVSGTALTVSSVPANVHINMQANSNKPGGWWVITSYPLP